MRNDTTPQAPNRPTEDPEVRESALRELAEIARKRPDAIDAPTLTSHSGLPSQP